MNTQRLLVDTDVLIDVGRGIPDSVAVLERHENDCQLLCSVITSMDCYVGEKL